MGQMTRAQICAEGLLTAMRPSDDFPTQVTGWLQRWLDSVAGSWPWPMLNRESIDLAVSGPSLVVGNGSGGVTEKILRILDNCWIYTSDHSFIQRLNIRTQLNKPQDRLAQSGATGKPTEARLFQTSFGSWTLNFSPNPDQSYLLSLPHLALPAALTADGDVPWYPVDETMVQAVAFKAHEYADGKDHPQTVATQQQLAALLSQDRIRYGSVNGINDVLQLDSTRFTRAKAP